MLIKKKIKTYRSLSIRSPLLPGSQGLAGLSMGLVLRGQQRDSFAVAVHLYASGHEALQHF